MNIITSVRNDMPNLAEVYFHDGITLGPMIALRAVGDELSELIVRTFTELEAQGTEQPTLGRCGAMLTFLAVGTGNEVSLNPAINRTSLGTQIAAMHSREYAPGGIGVVLVDISQMLVVTYGGRGFPEVQECNPFSPTTITVDQLRGAKPSGIVPVSAPRKDELIKPKKKGTRRKKAAGKKPPADEEVSVG